MHATNCGGCSPPGQSGKAEPEFWIRQDNQVAIAQGAVFEKEAKISLK